MATRCIHPDHATYSPRLRDNPSALLSGLRMADVAHTVATQ